MAPHPFFSYDSFVVGNKEELAIFMEDQNEERIFNFKNPTVTDITIEEQRNFDIEHTVAGDELRMPKSRHIKATITIETIDWESIWGEDIKSELPDIVEDMTVEELLHAVNQKLSGQ